MKKDNKSVTQRVAITGLSVALIIVAQFLGKLLPAGFNLFGPFNFNQLLTGSLVNLILILVTIKIDVKSALVAGFISPIMAMILQIGPIFPQLVLFIIAANQILVAIVSIFNSKSILNKIKYSTAFGIILASITKFLFLKTTIPLSFKLISNISEMQIKMLSIMFSWPQLITALTGGALALIINKITLKIKINSTNHQ